MPIQFPTPAAHSRMTHHPAHLPFPSKRKPRSVQLHASKSTLSVASNVSSRSVFTASKRRLHNFNWRRSNSQRANGSSSRRHCTVSTHTGSTLPLAVVFCPSLSICSPSSLRFRP
ncbi:hypothetical protein H5410_007494 [Solanum commersonii]|uniref:Uncharacterized protein n=1 Tax=Solanum commersonii TaxID=4109 RepID=A0A9J6AD99_SOLCO|nr:hypothetical protein H5410_007494 [Solanum commersonii]